MVSDVDDDLRSPHIFSFSFLFQCQGSDLFLF